MIRKNSVFLIAAAIALATSATPAAELHVGPGQTYTTIQSAINAATNGDTVIVADGTWTGDGNRDIDFKGKAITVKSENGPENCIIDCEATVDDPHLGFLVFSNNVRIEGFTIMHGRPRVDPRTSRIDVGGIYISRDTSDVVVNGCVLTLNEGGGIECHGANAAIEYCIVYNNGFYGVIWGSNGGRLSKCNIFRNTVGISSYSDTGPIEYCHATKNGTGMRLSGDAAVKECEVSENIYVGVKAYARTSAVLQRCRIMKNKGWGVDSTYNGSVGGDGLTIVDCLIVENEGGGVRADGPSRTFLYNCTIADNHSKGNGGGILAGRCTVSDCIIVGNSALVGDQIYARKKDVPLQIGRCLLRGGVNGIIKEAGAVVQGTGIVVDDDPNFAFPNDYHLCGSSVCIDRGLWHNLPGGNYNLYDLDGNERAVRRDGYSWGASDWGAYEYYGDRPTIALSDDNTVFSVAMGSADRQKRVVSIGNCGGAPLNWYVEEDCDWLELSPMSGHLGADEVGSVTVNVSGEGLGHGEHEYVVRFMDEQASNSPRILPVTLEVQSTLRVPQQYDTIQEALDDAVDGDVVIVADGRYTGDGNRNIDFKGKAITVKSANGPENCIIDCEGVRGELRRGFNFHMNEDYNSIVDGFTIINGYIGWGGAINCDIGSPRINNCILVGNIGSTWSSTVSIYNGSFPTISNCLIAGNSGDGPAIWANNSNVKIINSTIAMNTSASGCGGIRVDSGKLSLINSIVWGNKDRYGDWEYSQILTIRDSDYSPRSEHTYYYNCIEGWGADPNGVGNFESDPLFVDPIDGDFHLMPESPCINAGDPNGNYLPDFDVDFEGDRRVSFGRIDIGADEYLSYDLYQDDLINLSDFAILMAYWQEEGCASHQWCGFADFDSDGHVGFADLSLLAQKWLNEICMSNLLVSGHWSFDQANGVSAADSSMHDRDGVLVNMDDGSWVEGRVGNALAFDGLDDLVRIVGYKGIGEDWSRTVCAWIKTTDTAGEIISWGTATPGGRWVLLTEGSGFLRLEVGGGAVVGRTVVSDRQWHHVAAVLDNDGTANVNEVKLYVDGGLEELSSAGDKEIDTVVHSDLAPDVRIGVWNDGLRFFEGFIDEVRIYDRALSADEIAALAP